MRSVVRSVVLSLLSLAACTDPPDGGSTSSSSSSSSSTGGGSSVMASSSGRASSAQASSTAGSSAGSSSQAGTSQAASSSTSVVSSSAPASSAAGSSTSQVATSGASGSGSASASSAGQVSSSAGSSSLAGTSSSAAPSSSLAGGSSSGGPCTPAQLAALDQDIRTGMDAAVSRGDLQAQFTLMLEANDGRTLEYSGGGSTPDMPYESASTSKWVTATVILDAVDRGYLTLGTTANAVLPFWTENTVTLRHLLSFTSGLNDDLACQNLPGANFTNCVQNIYTNVWPTSAAAGAEFNYNSSHLQVAGLMAINASGAASWADLFAAFRTRTGLFPSSSYNLPSLTNPRLAGGMTWTPRDYVDFLRKLTRGEILSATTRTAMFANQRGAAVVTASPALNAGLHEDWAYGLGNWLECPTATGGTPFNCAEGVRNSSAGAYGSYPFIDFANGYFGLLAQMGPLGSGFKGVESFRPVEDAAARWAQQRCN